MVSRRTVGLLLVCMIVCTTLLVMPCTAKTFDLGNTTPMQIHGLAQLDFTNFTIAWYELRWREQARIEHEITCYLECRGPKYVSDPELERVSGMLEYYDMRGTLKEYTVPGTDYHPVILYLADMKFEEFSDRWEYSSWRDRFNISGAIFDYETATFSYFWKTKEKYDTVRKMLAIYDIQCENPHHKNKHFR